MIKCPYCGSTAQMKRLGLNEGENITIENYQCGCGTKVQRVLKRTMDVAWSPTGTMIYRKKF